MNIPYPPQTRSIRQWNDTPTRSVDASGTTFVYRRLGPAAGIPVIMLNHWGAVLDNFDPRIVDGIAAKRPVIAFNYRGVGASGGKAPLTVAEMAEDTIAPRWASRRSICSAFLLAASWHRTSC
jgi:pimeloyl-ACP methyl ester carboxylesterase